MFRYFVVHAVTFGAKIVFLLAECKRDQPRPVIVSYTSMQLSLYLLIIFMSFFSFEIEKFTTLFSKSGFGTILRN